MGYPTDILRLIDPYMVLHTGSRTEGEQGGGDGN